MSEFFVLKIKLGAITQWKNAFFACIRLRDQFTGPKHNLQQTKKFLLLPNQASKTLLKKMVLTTVKT